MADFSGRIRRIRIREEQGGTSFKTIVVVVGDTNEEVDHVKMSINEPYPAGVPSPSAYVCKSTKKLPANGGHYYETTGLQFDNGGKPFEAKYTVTAKMIAADGSQLGEAHIESVIVEDEDKKGGDITDPGDDTAEFKGRIHRIRIREEQGGTSFKVIVVVLGDATTLQVDKVNVLFNQPYNGPTPIPTEAVCSLVEIVKEEDKTRYMFEPLKFEGGALPLEKIYNVTGTMLNKSRQPIGSPVTQDVVVEGAESEVLPE